MIRTASFVSLGTFGLLLAIGCSKPSQDALPPATEWQSDVPATGGGSPAPLGRPKGVPSTDPHAAMMEGAGESSDPHAGVPGAPPIHGGGDQDPHAGVPGAPPIGSHGDPNNPQGDVGAAVDVTQLGLSSPDPSRAIDPTRRIKGVIKLNAKLKDRVKPGTAVFLMVRKPNADGQPSGSPIAVDRITWSADGQGFELTEANAMVRGAPDLVGDLVVMVRVDQDSDAMTKQPGDITGIARVKIPANGVVVELDTVLQ